MRRPPSHFAPIRPGREARVTHSRNARAGFPASFRASNGFRENRQQVAPPEGRSELLKRYCSFAQAQRERRVKVADRIGVQAVLLFFEARKERSDVLSVDLSRTFESARFKKTPSQKVEVDPGKADGDAAAITNAIGQTQTFSLTVASLYNQARTRSQLSRLTQTLDQEGVDLIRIFTDDNDPTAEVVEKRDRACFRHAEGLVLTDNEADMVLTIVAAMTNGSGQGWQFSEGCGGIAFHADVEDEDFLNRVKSREIKFENGTAVHAIVRTVQRRTNRTVTDRTVVEVKALLHPQGV